MRTIDFIDLCIRNNKKAMDELTVHSKELQDKRLAELKKMTMEELWEYTADLVESDCEDFPL